MLLVFAFSRRKLLSLFIFYPFGPVALVNFFLERLPWGAKYPPPGSCLASTLRWSLRPLLGTLCPLGILRILCGKQMLPRRRPLQRVRRAVPPMGHQGGLRNWRGGGFNNIVSHCPRRVGPMGGWRPSRRVDRRQGGSWTTHGRHFRVPVSASPQARRKGGMKDIIMCPSRVVEGVRSVCRPFSLAQLTAEGCGQP